MFGSKNNNTLQYGIMPNNEAIVLESVCLEFWHNHHFFLLNHQLKWLIIFFWPIK
jgi:hypothetical protein